MKSCKVKNEIGQYNNIRLRVYRGGLQGFVCRRRLLLPSGEPAASPDLVSLRASKTASSAGKRFFPSFGPTVMSNFRGLPHIYLIYECCRSQVSSIPIWAHHMWPLGGCVYSTSEQLVRSYEKMDERAPQHIAPQPLVAIKLLAFVLHVLVFHFPHPELAFCFLREKGIFFLSLLKLDLSLQI